MKLSDLDEFDLVYIMGYGRSGSTLIESEIVSSFNMSAFGEVKYVSERGARKNELCSCGSHARDCEVWSKIINQLEQEFDLQEMEAITNKLDSSKKFPVNFILYKMGYLKPKVDAYRQFNFRLYQLLSSYGKFIESSKMPARAYFLFADKAVTSSYEMRPKLIWVVRDSRGVAWSCGRKVKRGEAQHSEDEYMPVFGYYSAIVKWLINGLVSLFVFNAVKDKELIKYEEFVLEMSNKSRNSTTNDMKIENTAIHSISGNPRRFTGGMDKIKLDIEWLQKLPWHKRFLGWLIGMPLNIWLKYRI